MSEVHGERKETTALTDAGGEELKGARQPRDARYFSGISWSWVSDFKRPYTKARNDKLRKYNLMQEESEEFLERKDVKDLLNILEQTDLRSMPDADFKKLVKRAADFGIDSSEQGELPWDIFELILVHGFVRFVEVVDEKLGMCFSTENSHYGDQNWLEHGLQPILAPLDRFVENVRAYIKRRMGDPGQAEPKEESARLGRLQEAIEEFGYEAVQDRLTDGDKKLLDLPFGYKRRNASWNLFRDAATLYTSLEESIRALQKSRDAAGQGPDALVQLLDSKLLVRTLTSYHYLFSLPDLEAVSLLLERSQMVVASNSQFHPLHCALAQSGKTRFVYGRLEKSPTGKTRVVLSESFVLELNRYAVVQGLSARQKREFILAYVLQLFINDCSVLDSVERSELKRHFSRFIATARIIFSKPQDVPDSVLISRVLTGAADYTFYHSEDNYEGWPILLFRRLANRAKQWARREGKIVKIQAGRLEVFLEHLQLKDQIRVARNENRLHQKDEDILDGLLSSDNAELREVTVESLSRIKAADYSTLQEKIDINLRCYLGWLKIRRMFLLAGGHLWILLGLSVASMGWLEHPWKPWMYAWIHWAPYGSIFFLGVQMFSLIVLSTGLDSSLPFYKGFVRYCLLAGLAEPDFNRRTADSEEGIARQHKETGVRRFDDATYQRILRVNPFTGEVLENHDAAADPDRQVRAFIPTLKLSGQGLTDLLKDRISEEEKSKWETVRDKWTKGEQLQKEDALCLLKLLQRYYTKEDVPWGVAEGIIFPACQEEWLRQAFSPADRLEIKQLRSFRENQERIDRLIQKIRNRETSGKDRIRIKIWDRMSLLDASNTNELEACCFIMGTSQIDILLFLMNGSISMLDFYNHKGRMVRAFLADAYRVVEGRKEPVLLVFDVEGKRRRLLPGWTVTDQRGRVLQSDVDAENRFIRSEIEKYAAEAGYRSVVYNSYVTNPRPRSFISFLEKVSQDEESGIRKVSKLKLGLTTERDQVNLETFGVPRNLLLRQFKMAFGLIKMEAVEGRIDHAYEAKTPRNSEQGV